MSAKYLWIIVTFLIVVLLIEVVLINYYNPLTEDIIVLQKEAEHPRAKDFNILLKQPKDVAEEEISEPELIEPPEVILIPKKFALDVPFTSQAPHADWNEIFNDACEEASVIMFDFYINEKELDKDIATAEILDLVDWQNQNFGYFKDTSIEETGQILQNYYSYDNVVVKYFDQITADDLKYYIFNHGPIIVPAAGRLLNNKYFTGAGPLYHMLVLVGYDDKNFIANDPGTRRGKNYPYSYQTILEAIHDLPTTGKNDVLKGQKAILYLE